MKRSSLILGALASVVVAASAWFLLQTRHSLPDDPLAAIPADAYGVGRIRVDRVLASQAWKRLVVERGEARGIERVTALCGFNPLEGIRELVVFARPAPRGGTPRFAFTARGKLKHEQLIDCVRKMTGKGGSKLTQEDIEGIPTVRSEKGSSRAAFVGSDGIVGGDSDSVVAVINTMLGKAPSAATDPVLHDLYKDIGETTDVALAARVPDALKPMVQLLSQLGGPDTAALSGVRAISASANLSDDKITGGAVLLASSQTQATSIVRLVTGLRERLLLLPGIGLTGISGMLHGVQMEVLDTRATFGGTLKLSVADTIIELLPAIASFGEGLVGAQQQGQAAPPSDPQPAPATPQAAAPAPKANATTPTVQSLDAPKKKPAPSKRAP